MNSTTTPLPSRHTSLSGTAKWQVPDPPVCVNRLQRVDSGITNAGKCVVLLSVYRRLLQYMIYINNRHYFRNYPNVNSYDKPVKRRTTRWYRCISIQRFIDGFVDGEREGPAVSLAVLRGRHSASRFDNREGRGKGGPGSQAGAGRLWEPLQVASEDNMHRASHSFRSRAA